MKAGDMLELREIIGEPVLSEDGTIDWLETDYETLQIQADEQTELSVMFVYLRSERSWQSVSTTQRP